MKGAFLKDEQWKREVHGFAVSAGVLKVDLAAFPQSLQVTETKIRMDVAASEVGRNGRCNTWEWQSDRDEYWIEDKDIHFRTNGFPN